jgi:protein phosphatase
MGGLQAGAQAAEIALGAALQIIEFDSTRQSLQLAFQRANRDVWTYGARNGFEGRVGSTLLACVTLGNRYLIANVGDSRCYYVNQTAAWPLTEDHSRAQEMVRLGAMTDAQARTSPFRNELTRCLGEPHDVHVDVFPCEHWGVIDEDCVLFVCSDGLHNWVADGEISATLLGKPSLKRGCEALIELAIKNGSTDNVSVAAAEFGRIAGTRRRWFSWFR